MSSALLMLFRGSNLLRNFLIFLLFSFVFLSAHLTINAQTYSSDSQYNHVDSNVELNSYNKTQIKLVEASGALICLLTNINIVNPTIPCIGLNSTTQTIGYNTAEQGLQLGGLLGFQTQLIAYTFVPPASTEQSVRYLAENFGITKKSLAQDFDQTTRGQGFAGLGPIHELWLLIRNLVYVLVIIVFIIIGLAIMLRVKIDPRTVMSVQNQIPKIVVGLILITFSYSIAGLLIDVMWASTYLGVNLIGSSPQCINDENPQPPLSAKATERILDNPFGFADDMFGSFSVGSMIPGEGGTYSFETPGPNTEGEATLNLADNPCFGAMSGLPGLAFDVGKTFGDVVKNIFEGIFGITYGEEDCGGGIIGTVKSLFTNPENCIKKGAFGVIKWAVSIIAFVVVTISLVVALFKTWFTLLKAYVSIMIAVILSPLWILMGIVPGSTHYNFTQWIRHMVAHLAVFPATVFLIMLASMLTSNVRSNNPENSFLPPLIGNPNIADNMGVIAGFAVLMFIPDALNAIRDGLKSGQGKYTGNIYGRAASGNPMTPLKSAGQLGYSVGGLGSLPGASKIPGLNKFIKPKGH